MDSTDVVLALPDSSLPLAHCMGLETGEPFGVVDRFNVVDACFEPEDTLDELYNLVETPLKGSHDVFMHEES